ncbi:MAG: GTPase ObgE [Microbacteriaceae bacterium]|jgi:GTPase|nr:MAG: GTPase CgtA [Microbacteriaceae bacterium BACL25 MAG-120322-bin65]|tara:strand:+ start:4452 stop:5957 length:1506 start_codon:yes stop_codon:yes gene_type:complete
MTTFVDRVVLHLSAGHGGNGCVSVRREKFKPLGGPDGGNGGNGGDVILVADPQVTTLLDYHHRPHRSSENGSPGMGDSRHGKTAPDVTLAVPVGTVVSTSDGDLIVDLDRPGMSVTVAAAGKGGLGNEALANNARKAPGFALLGTLGFDGDINLELKTVADVALVGFPSAGKSSLIAAVSQATPKIADYPFTTLHPNLGVVSARGVRFTIADVPGLIPGASQGKGLGLEFLRHVERCSVLVHVLDCATLEPGRDPLGDLDALLEELENYPLGEKQIPLTQRPQLVVLNKADVPDARDLATMVAPDLRERGYEVFVISAISGEGLDDFLNAAAALVAQYRAAQEIIAANPPRIVVRPKAVNEALFHVKRDGSLEDPLFRIIGEKPERWVEQTDFSNDEAVGYLADRLMKIGIDDALFAAGATPGCAVVIGLGHGQVFDWEPTLSSAAELMTAPRGSDPRLDERSRPTRLQRKATYHERMDAKSRAREELTEEREAGMYSDDD